MSSSVFSTSGGLTATRRYVLLVAGCIAMTFLGGWIGFYSSLTVWPESSASVLLAQRFIVGVTLLVLAWRLLAQRLEARSRREARWICWAVLFAWYLGCGVAIPAGWKSFFANEWGEMVWVLFSVAIAAPAYLVLLIPQIPVRVALGAASLFSALMPIGMMNPVLASTAFFPGLGVVGLMAAILVLFLPCLRHDKGFVLVLVLLGVGGSAYNQYYDTTLSHQNDAHRIQAQSFALVSEEGVLPTDARLWMNRQARSVKPVVEAIKNGHRLVITPETTVEMWDIWAILAWREAIEVAKSRQAQLLIGIHYQDQSGWKNGLFDPIRREFYGATMTMPISLWRPWHEKKHYPFDITQLTRVIPTAHGQAAYLICWEEMLLWPLTVKMTLYQGQERPRLLITSSNQWFTNTSTSVTQERSIAVQARLWGLPLLRSVNWPATTSASASASASLRESP